MSEQIEAEDFIKPEVTAKEERLFKEAGEKVVDVIGWMSNSGIKSVENDAKLLIDLIKGNIPGSLGFHLGRAESSGEDGPPFHLEWSKNRKEMALVGSVEYIVREPVGSIILILSHEATHIRQTLRSDFKPVRRNEWKLLETEALLHAFFTYRDIKERLNYEDEIFEKMFPSELLAGLSPEEIEEVVSKVALVVAFESGSRLDVGFDVSKKRHMIIIKDA